jgi:hypothetical protein
MSAPGAFAAIALAATRHSVPWHAIGILFILQLKLLFVELVLGRLRVPTKVRLLLCVLLAP